MPVYQRNVFSIAKPLENVGLNEKVFTIAHTGEQFRNESEYQARCELYSQQVWTCQCTGHSNLTHQQAWDSEHRVRAMLEKQFPPFLIKPVLTVVHHSTKPLDALIDEANGVIHSRLHKDEAVLCIGHNKSLGRVVDAVAPDNGCGSPSSDKENSKDSESSSPRKSSKDAASPRKASKDAATPRLTSRDGGSPRKPSKEESDAGSGAGGARLPVKMLALLYTVRLSDSDRLLTGLAPTELSRAEKLPNRDTLRLFIRSSAMRHGTGGSAPWVVSPSLFVQHSLKNKIASIFLPATATGRSGQSNAVKSSLPPKKRKLKVDADTSSKKQKAGKDVFKHTPTNAQTINKLSTHKMTQESSATKTVSVANGTIADSDSDSEVLANICSTSKPKNILKEVSPSKAKFSPSVVLSPIKHSQGHRGDDSDDDDIKLIQLAKDPVKKLIFGNGGSATKKSDKTKKESSKNKKNGKSQTKNKKPDKTEGKVAKKKEVVKKKRGRPPKEGPTKKMKQMSLFDLGNKKKTETSSKGTEKQGKSPQKSSPQKSPRKPTLPLCVRKLTREIDAGKKIVMGNSLLNTCVNVLRREQLALITHEQTRALILKRRAMIEEGRLLARMTPEQREVYLKRKKEQQREEQKAKLEERRIEKSLRFEDQSLQLSPLPAACPVSLPAGLPADMFGSVASITEFLSCYSGLLGAEATPPELSHVGASLTGGERSEKRLLDLVAPLLKVLVNDEDEETLELGTPLRKVPATPQTATELVRLTLRPGLNEDGDPICHWLRASLLTRLETCELFELSSGERLEVLHALVDRCLVSDAAAEHQETTEERVRKLWHQKIAIFKDRKTGDVEATSTAQNDANAALPEREKQPEDVEGQEEEAETGARSARLRRNPEEARKEREKREAETKARREAQLQQEQKRRDEEATLREHEQVSARHAALQRRLALGEDRHHRRYWLLPSLPAALYVEAGWAPPETLQYRVSATAAQTAAPAPDGDDSDDEQPLKAIQQRAAAGHEDLKQATLPEPGLNLWYQYTSIREVDSLLAALAEKGVRESVLRKAIITHYPTLKTMLATSGGSVVQLADANVSLVKAENQNVNVKSETTTATEKLETEAATDDAISQPEAAPDKKDIAVASADNPSQSSDAAADSESKASTELSGRQFLLSTLKEDLLSIEEDLRGGGIGGVSDGDDWAARVLSAEQLPPLAEALRHSQAHVMRHALQGPLATEDGENAWLRAVQRCGTLSRLHVLVGLFDSCIKWDLSKAEKKCKVCRRRGEGEVAVCGGCFQLYHWLCQRPRLDAPPEPDWRCTVCRPATQRLRTRQPAPAGELADEFADEAEASEPEREEECRVCGDASVEEMIFCTRCPAAFHKNCHQPAVLLRIRPGWECMDCQAMSARKKRGSRSKSSRQKQPLPSELLRAARAADQEHSSDDEEAEDDGGNEEQEADGEDNTEEDEEGEVEDEEEAEEEDEDHGDEEEEESSEEQEESPPPKSRKCAFVEESVNRRAATKRRISSDAEEEEDAGETSARCRSGGRRAAKRRASSDEDDDFEPEHKSRGHGGRVQRSATKRRVSSDSDYAEEGASRRRSGRRAAAARRTTVVSDDELSDEEAVKPARRGSGRARDPLRHSERRSSGRGRVKYTERSESDLEPSEDVEQAVEPEATQREPSPNKLDLTQRPDALCMYCGEPRTHRNELAVCRTCPALYHRRCASRAGLVDAWQCADCVLPGAYRARPPAPRPAAARTAAAGSNAAQQDSGEE